MYDQYDVVFTSSFLIMVMTNDPTVSSSSRVTVRVFRPSSKVERLKGVLSNLGVVLQMSFVRRTVEESYHIRPYVVFSLDLGLGLGF
jgi:hypothetical protein